jgi:hypothetical protein
MNIRNRQEFIDYDYIDKLSEKEKALLDKFTGEFYGAAFDDNPIHDIRRNKKAARKLSKKQIRDKNKALYKSCTDANNARNRCTYSIKKSVDMMKDITSVAATIEKNNIKDASLVEAEFEGNIMLRALLNADVNEFIVLLSEYGLQDKYQLFKEKKRVLNLDDSEIIPMFREDILEFIVGL